MTSKERFADFVGNLVAAWVLLNFSLLLVGLTAHKFSCAPPEARVEVLFPGFRLGCAMSHLERIPR